MCFPLTAVILQLNHFQIPGHYVWSSSEMEGCQFSPGRFRAPAHINPMRTVIFKKALPLKYLNTGFPGTWDQRSGPESRSSVWCCVDVNRGQDLGWLTPSNTSKTKLLLLLSTQINYTQIVHPVLCSWSQRHNQWWKHLQIRNFHND